MVRGHLTNQSFGLLVALNALILQSFRGRKQFRIKCFRADRLADLERIPLYGGQESRARTFQQVPAIRNLNRPRQGARNSAAIACVTVSGDNLDPWAGTQPCLDRAGSRSGSKSTTLRHSGSQIKVPYFCPLRHAQSSISMTRSSQFLAFISYVHGVTSYYSVGTQTYFWSNVSIS